MTKIVLIVRRFTRQNDDDVDDEALANPVASQLDLDDQGRAVDGSALARSIAAQSRHPEQATPNQRVAAELESGVPLQNMIKTHLQRRRKDAFSADEYLKKLGETHQTRQGEERSSGSYL